MPPTIEQCREYMEAYLHVAEQTLGGVGFAWIKINKHLRLEDFHIAPEGADK